MLVEHDKYCSIILSNFHCFDDYFGDKEGGGYTIEILVKRLLKENKITGVKFDSEAGMFCAYSENKEKLKELCDLFKPLVGNEEDFQVEAKEPLIPLDDAEKLLLKGFVLSLDKKAQEDFFKYVPYPTLSKKQFEYIEAIQNGDEHAMINAAKKINSETRTLTRKWDNYL